VGKQRSAATNAPEPDATPVFRGKVHRVYTERGFGFIRCSEGKAEDIGQDFFFHRSGLSDDPIDELEEGEAVLFEPRYTAKGRRAERIARDLR
jgi:cold shock CspA family protein